MPDGHALMEGQPAANKNSTCRFSGGHARVFNTVEGNTTFYALPRPDVVERWKESTPSNFRFCFKFPRSISHDRKLENTTELTREFFQRIAPLEERIGPIQLQLSADFGQNRWPQLQQFLRQLSSDFRYAVEVRDLAYFDGRKRSKSWMRFCVNTRWLGCSSIPTS